MMRLVGRKASSGEEGAVHHEIWVCYHQAHGTLYNKGSLDKMLWVLFYY